MGEDKVSGSFVWDIEKEQKNILRHGLNFNEASLAFFDSGRVIAVDELHSEVEERYFCIGRAEGRVLTVRFTFRGGMIRIIGAGYWRKGRRLYEEKNQTHR